MKNGNIMETININGEVFKKSNFQSHFPARESEDIVRYKGYFYVRTIIKHKRIYYSKKMILKAIEKSRIEANWDMCNITELKKYLGI